MCAVSNGSKIVLWGTQILLALIVLASFTFLHDYQNARDEQVHHEKCVDRWMSLCLRIEDDPAKCVFPE